MEKIGSMAEKFNSDIEPGQCFKRNGMGWKVVGFTSVNGIPHVQIMKADNSTERKLISLGSLRDGYDLVNK